ncbi:MAG: signal peptidase II [Verrucomicrobiaceae bacterium]|nr:signal peptidase II [Verrucomicrobiaceae bacterium]
MVDFLKFDLKFMIWPSFNVADSCVVCAAMLLFVSSFIEKPVGVEKA